MPEYHELIADNAPIVIGATGLQEIEQNIRIIVLTTVFSVPMDRSFANTGSYIDSPLPQATAGRIAELIRAIEKYEPRVAVVSIRMQETRQTSQDLLDGKYCPVIKYRLRQGVSI